MLLPYYLPTIEEDLSAIVGRTYREVNPIRGAALLLDQLVKHPAVFISCIEQQTGIPDHLLRPQTPDIHRATRQMITPLRVNNCNRPFQNTGEIGCANFDFA